jgi:glycosyltransferase involved in cell wall biosynthesis
MSARLLIVDPNVSLSSPSMRGVVLSLAALKARSMEIEVWCWDCDLELPVDKVVRLPRFGKIHTVGYYAFSFWAMLRAWWLFRVQREARPEIIFTVAWYLPHCDVALVQFSPWDWAARQRTLGIHSWRDLYERLTNALSLMWANHAVRTTTARKVLCVSEAVASDVRARRPALSIALLPNCYDPGRFHPGVRALHRDSVRARLHFAAEEMVLIFVSTGHYRRKGFFLAVQALEVVRRSHPQVRFLVVGGLERRLKSLQAELDGAHPGWRDWITFTGMVPDVEKYFAAADGFLFPSYSEAFALVEVEAAACGLPLFLTRHHGSEMILEEGVNGLSLEFAAEPIAEVLGRFVTGQWTPAASQVRHALDKTQYAQRLAAELMSVSRALPVHERISSTAIPVS